MKLLEDSQEVDIYNQTQKLIHEMIGNAELSEFWMGNKDDIDALKKSKSFISRLEFISDLCVYNPDRKINSDDAIGDDFADLEDIGKSWDNEDSKIVNEVEIIDNKNQNLLRNLQATRVPLTIIK